MRLRCSPRRCGAPGRFGAPGFSRPGTTEMSFQPDRGVTKNAAALFVGRTAVMALSFVLGLYAARLLGLAGFGRYAIARMYFDLLLTLGVTGLTILITREIAKSPRHAPLYL